jgi:hypothetical protein
VFLYAQRGDGSALQRIKKMPRRLALAPKIASLNKKKDRGVLKNKRKEKKHQQQ